MGTCSNAHNDIGIHDVGSLLLEVMTKFYILYMDTKKERVEEVVKYLYNVSKPTDYHHAMRKLHHCNDLWIISQPKQNCL